MRNTWETSHLAFNMGYKQNKKSLSVHENRQTISYFLNNC